MPYRPSIMKTEPWYLNWLLPALLAALIIPTIFIFPDPICDSIMIDHAFSCPPKAVWVWFAVVGHLDTILYTLVRDRVWRIIDGGDSRTPIWLLDSFFFLNIMILPMAATLQAVGGFPGISVLPKGYKVRYIIVFILNIVTCWNNCVGIVSTTDAMKRCTKAQDQERDTGGVAREMQEDISV
ncbi:hypothetical protein M422DRAFT_264573 [Sphaerobolus stellatus SS14]|uniref:Transmembrane protein n=1 Tax=Sphaerobolus stellatus (strain SS14) TaxID=990650 RepID=A0A0C9TT83_SPHS4|nr:hypothetical protein M422DRAFT_264573 [Sphaerobolus stellatus SS14]